MKRSEFKSEFFCLLDQPIDGASLEEKIALTEKYFIEYQRKHDDERERPNTGKPWKDAELRAILQSAPTVKNCLKYAKLFGRGYGSIEEIYRWAATTDKEVQEKRAEDTFGAQVKRIAKEIGWRAY